MSGQLQAFRSELKKLCSLPESPESDKKIIEVVWDALEKAPDTKTAEAITFESANILSVATLLTILLPFTGKVPDEAVDELFNLALEECDACEIQEFLILISQLRCGLFERIVTRYEALSCQQLTLTQYQMGTGHA